MQWMRLLAMAVCCFTAMPVFAAGDPTETVRQSEEVLAELMAIPGRQIPQRLLSEAQAVAIIPRVIKIGFIAGARRGHGVILVRDADGEWSLPQFLTLTGGSVGWQAGVQGTDVVLVFRTRESVQSLMKGKFTIGADASATAGPVGRNASAATDGQLRAEILSYSRSRGLFLGVAIDGSVLEVDPMAHFAFYGSGVGELPRAIPDAAAQLRQYLAELTPSAGGTGVPGEAIAMAAPSADQVEVLREALNRNAGQLHAILNPEWRQYLAFPQAILQPSPRPSVEELTALQQRFALIESSPNYKELTARPEFQSTLELLREYTKALSSASSTLQLPPPPGAK